MTRARRQRVDWTARMDSELLRLRAVNVTFRGCGKQLGVTRGSAIGRHGRLVAGPDAAPRKRKDAGQTHTSARQYREIRPAAVPYASDSSCPDFAHDDRHCTAVLARGGFPRLQIEYPK